MTTEKDLKKLSKTDLFEIVSEQKKEIEKLTREIEKLTKEGEQLTKELEEANAKLNSKDIMIEEAGSIAEASLKVSGIFESAEASAKQYLDNIARLNEQQEEISAKRIAECEETCTTREKECEEFCAKREEECEEFCTKREEECEEFCVKREEECEETIRRVLAETAKYCKELRRVVEKQ